MGWEFVCVPMSVWRDAQAQAETIQRRNHWRPVRAVGVDGAAVLGWGEKRSVLVAVDLGTGEPIALANVMRRNYLRWSVSWPT